MAKIEKAPKGSLSTQNFPPVQNSSTEGEQQPPVNDPPVQDQEQPEPDVEGAETNIEAGSSAQQRHVRAVFKKGDEEVVGMTGSVYDAKFDNRGISVEPVSP